MMKGRGGNGGTVIFCGYFGRGVDCFFHTKHSSSVYRFLFLYNNITSVL